MSNSTFSLPQDFLTRLQKSLLMGQVSAIQLTL